MKKYVLLFLIVGLVAQTANAGMLSMEFAGGGNEATLAYVSDTVTVDVVWTMHALDGPGPPPPPAAHTLTALAMRFNLTTNDPRTFTGGETFTYDPDHITVQSVSTPLSGWGTGATVGVGNYLTDDQSFYLAAGDTSPTFANAIVGDGSVFSTIVTSFTLHCESIEQKDLYLSYFVTGDGAGPMPTAKDGIGTWAFNWFGLGAPGEGQYYIGQGNPGDMDSGHQYNYGYEVAQPLIIHNIPEPASLALLALGGLALIRRR